MKKERNVGVVVLLLAIGAGFLSGCASVGSGQAPAHMDHAWFNPTLPIHLQSPLFDQENTFCQQAAYQWRALPDIVFEPGLVRVVNDLPNASVGGQALSSTPAIGNIAAFSQSSQSIPSSLGSIRRYSIQGARERRDHLQCLQSLGWQGVSQVWDGTPDKLNETFAINARVMDLKRSGYSHPFLDGQNVVMIDLANSKRDGSAVLIKSASVDVTGAGAINYCDFRVETTRFTKRAWIACDGNPEIAVSYKAGRPVREWARHYFLN